MVLANVTEVVHLNLSTVTHTKSRPIASTKTTDPLFPPTCANLDYKFIFYYLITYKKEQDCMMSTHNYFQLCFEFLYELDYLLFYLVVTYFCRTISTSLSSSSSLGGKILSSDRYPSRLGAGKLTFLLLVLFKQ